MRALVLALFCGCAPAASAVDVPAPGIDFAAPVGSVRGWRFAVHGLPATDPRTGDILVADVGRERLAASQTHAILALRPAARPREVALLVDAETLERLFVMEDPDEETRVTNDLAGRVRARVVAANRDLAARELRPLVTCRVAENVFCKHPQRIACADETFTLAGDMLGTVKTGWAIPPLEIGDGPPKSMLACIEEAHLDPVTRQLAVRLDHVCEGGGSDACILPDEWHVVAGLDRK